MNTRKHPRTMQAAFGPYTDNTLYPMRDLAPPRPWVWISVYSLALAVVLVLVLFH